MRVLYIHQYYATPESNGGVRSYQISKALAKKGHNVEIITSSAFTPKHWKLKKGWNRRIIDGVKVSILKLPYSNKTSFLKRIWLFINFSCRSTFKALNIDCDVVFATSTPLTIAIPGVLASRKHRAPLVFEVRDLWPEIPIAMGIIKSRPLIYLAKILEKWAYRNSNQVIALSSGMRTGIEKADFPSNLIHEIPNFSDVELFGIDPMEGERFKKRYSWANGRKLAVYTGTFGKVNNLAYLVDVACFAKELDPSLCFVLIGDGAEKNMLQNMAEERGVLDSNLFFLPPVSKKDLPAILSASDICISTVLPIIELWHNSANKFFDALAAGRPLAINHYGWQAQIIQRHDVGLVMNPDDPQAGAAALVESLQNSSWTKTARRNARALASEVFSHDIMSSKVEKVLLKAIAE